MPKPQCPICLEKIYPVELISTTECKHTFHRQCLIPWTKINNSCPLCRTMLHFIPPHGHMIKTLKKRKRMEKQEENPAEEEPVEENIFNDVEDVENAEEDSDDDYIFFTLGLIQPRRNRIL